MRKKNFIKITLLCLITSSLWGQGDIHFSQFNDAPLTLNPALAGSGYGDVRLVSNYRTQWGAISSPYSTMAFSIDKKIFRGNFALGGSFVNDISGDSKLRTTNIDIAIAYRLDLSGGQKKSFLSVGFQPSLVQRTFGFNELYFDNQWDGYGFDEGINHQEATIVNEKKVFDLSTGLNYINTPRNGLKFYAGFAIGHVTSPNVSFNSEENPLLKKYTIHAGASIRSPQSQIAVVPSVLYTKQGPNTNTILGSELKYLLQKASRYTTYKTETSISAGLFYRYKDATYIVAKLYKENYAIGLSYDINISKLVPATKTVGGIEIMLSYFPQFYKEKKHGI